MKPKVLAALFSLLLAGGSVGGYILVRDNDADLFEHSVHHVVHVVDGDTIDIENDTRIRLLGVDAPERSDCFYNESKAYLEELIEGETIRIEKDISGSDRYDRLLRYVYLASDDPKDDDIFVQDALVRAGYADVFAQAPDNRYRDLLSSAREEARKEERGMWRACDLLVEEDSLREQATGPSDPSCTIKGNISEKGYGKSYFLEGCPNYNRVKVDTRKGESYFCSEDEAQAAGFTRSESCANAFGAEE
ncbi:MAG: thermonuclease family protein [Patescibacteria group bacterium UBA2163]